MSNELRKDNERSIRAQIVIARFDEEIDRVETSDNKGVCYLAYQGCEGAKRAEVFEGVCSNYPLRCDRCLENKLYTQKELVA